jgi:HEAT repeat protein
MTRLVRKGRMAPMKRKWVIVGIAFVVVGLLGRYAPRVVTGISFWTLLQVAGVVILIREAWICRKSIRSWIVGAPIGKHTGLVVALFAGFLLLDLGAGIVREIRIGRKYDRVAADLEKDDPVAAISLARHFHAEENPALRERIVVRMGELGNSSPRVTGTLREAVKTDPDASVREAAADALVSLMTPADVLAAILSLPDLSAEVRPAFVDILSRHTGKDYGEDVRRWLEWAASTWLGEKGEAAYQLALTAWRKSADQGAVREYCLHRLENPEGVTEQTLSSTLQHEDPRVRAAAAAAMGRSGAQRWMPVLLSRLKAEADPTAARSMVGAMRQLDPDRSGMTLLEVLRTGTNETAKGAARHTLAQAYQVAGGAADAFFITAVRNHLPPGPDRRMALAMLIEEARTSTTAAKLLKGVLNDPEEDSLDRGRALDGILAGTGHLENDELVGLLENAPSTDFAQKVRGELKRRTGKDGGRDAEAWRKILREAE